MKTTIGVQKTENRNSKTSIMKTFVLVTGMALFSFMTSASVKSNHQMENEGDKLFYAHASLAVNSPVMEPLHLTEAAMEISAEESLEVESWMINENIFASPLPVAETEESLEVEPWMLTAENFVDTLHTQESEKALEVESWMLDQNRWNN